MPPNPVPPALPLSEAAPSRPRRRRRLLAVLLIVVGGFATVAIGAVRMFSSGADARALNATVMEATGGDWQPNIQVRVGPAVLALARVVTALVPDVPPEARTALRALHSAEVSIHHLQGTRPAVNGRELLANADRRLTARGWERIVGVVDHQQVVGVFVPAGAAHPRDLSCCVLVFDGHELITVSGRADLEQLAELAWRLRDEPTSPPWISRRAVAAR